MIRLSLLIILALAQLATILAPIKCLYAIITNNTSRAWDLLIGYDQLGNSVFNGSSDQTISARAYLASLQGKHWGCILCRILDKIQKDHCKNSITPNTTETP